MEEVQSSTMLFQRESHVSGEYSTNAVEQALPAEDAAKHKHVVDMGEPLKNLCWAEVRHVQLDFVDSARLVVELSDRFIEVDQCGRLAKGIPHGPPAASLDDGVTEGDKPILGGVMKGSSNVSKTDCSVLGR